MPASPISKIVNESSDIYPHLEKVIIPDQATGCYWSVWYDVEINWNDKGTAWLMWCPIGDDPSVNDSWSHAEEINGDCRNVLDTIEAVYGISFHEFIYDEYSMTHTAHRDEKELPSE